MGGDHIRKGKKKKIIVTAIVLVLVILVTCAFNETLTVRYYQIESDKIEDHLRIAFIADLHSCYYGEGQSELLRCIDEQHPDIILFGGDIVDDKLPYENAETVLRAAAQKYPCYYVSGNHEYWSGNIDTIKQMIANYGMIILEGQSEVISVRGQSINVCGIDDAEIGARDFMKQIKSAESEADPTLFTVFMAHRPEYIDTYLQHDFDLILSGHSHGGQWRIPGIINGLIVPNQGFFPKYAGGKYQFGNKTFIVSRGLAKESTRIPRIFNPPELVVVDVVAQ